MAKLVIQSEFDIVCFVEGRELLFNLNQGWGAGVGAGAGAAWKKTGAGAAKKLAGSSALRKLYFCYSSLGKIVSFYG